MTSAVYCGRKATNQTKQSGVVIAYDRTYFTVLSKSRGSWEQTMDSKIAGRICLPLPHITERGDDATWDASCTEIDPHDRHILL